ncbi:hypothetical protein ACFLU9_01490 [Chloroflexota bacterium]
MFSADGKTRSDVACGRRLVKPVNEVVNRKGFAIGKALSIYWAATKLKSSLRG